MKWSVFWLRQTPTDYIQNHEGAKQPSTTKLRLAKKKHFKSVAGKNILPTFRPTPIFQRQFYEIFRDVTTNIYNPVIPIFFLTLHLVTPIPIPPGLRFWIPTIHHLSTMASYVRKG